MRPLGSIEDIPKERVEEKPEPTALPIYEPGNVDALKGVAIDDLEGDTMTPNDAFESAMSEPVLSFHTGRIYEFDMFREVAAQNMGLALFNMGEDAAAQFAETGTYNGAFQDSIIVAYLRCHNERVAKKAISAPSHYRNLAIEWGGKNKIRIATSRHSEVIDFFGSTIQPYIAALAEPDEDENEPSSSGDGERLGK